MTARTFLDVPSADVEATLKKLQAPAFRRKQIQDWLFNRQALSFSQMSDLPAGLRTELEREFRLHPLQIFRKEESRLDGTRRYFFRAHDGKAVSTVYLPEGADRLSLCLSSQVGCAYKCTFCASGLVPFQRQLSAAEIVDQILLIRQDSGRMPTNLLFMGMGEPLANYVQVVQAIRLISSPDGLGMSPSRITLSTSGLIPQIERLADDGIRVRLAISLHSVRDETRLKIMPVSGRFAVRPLVKAARYFANKTQSEVTFEYILLAGVNDFLIDANRLAYLSKGFLCKVNLIPYNPVAGLPYQRPDGQAVHRFQQWLRERGVTAFVRKPKGLDIGSACGQLGAGAPAAGRPSSTRLVK